MQENSFVEYQREGNSGQWKERYDFFDGNVVQTRLVEKFDVENKGFWQKF